MICRGLLQARSPSGAIGESLATSRGPKVGFGRYPSVPNWFGWLDGNQSRRTYLRMVALAVLAAAVFVLNRGHLIEQGVYESQYLPYARHIAGETTREILSYPMWGYPLAIHILGETGLLIAQYALSLLGFVFIYRTFFSRYDSNVYSRIIVAVSAVPWFAYMSVKWPSAIAVPLLWIGLCEVAVALRDGSGLRRYLSAGLLIGLALNFRSEFLLLLIFVVAVGAAAFALNAKPTPGAKRTSILGLGAVLIGAVGLLMPWGVFNLSNSGEFTLLSTNGASVAVISLGQLPGNPWGIVHDDAEAQRILESLGRESLDPYSAAGNRALSNYFVRAITDHPVAYARKVIRNLRNVFLGGFYVGDWKTLLTEDGRTRADVLTEKVKELVGVNPNLAEIEGYKKSGIWYESPILTWALPVLGATVVYLAASDVIIVVGTFGGLWLLFRRQLDIVAATAWTFGVSVVMLAAFIQYQPRHITPALPALVAVLLVVLSRARAVPGETATTEGLANGKVSCST